MSERAKLVERPERFGLDRVELLREVFTLYLLASHVKPYEDPYQPLLRAVVKIALKTPSLLLDCLDDPRARRAQLVDQACVLKHQRGRGQPLESIRVGSIPTLCEQVAVPARTNLVVQRQTLSWRLAC